MSSHDFGSGPVPAHQHHNGGGWVADTASVDATVYVGPNAVVADYAMWGVAAIGAGYLAGLYVGYAVPCLHYAVVSDRAVVSGDAKVLGAKVSGRAVVTGDAQ